ncbi:hypothetical protein KKG71_02210, partial [Patescibacteria group bacterium]|nr:hypothetical protein [Patescibacteria group bacterium]
MINIIKKSIIGVIVLAICSVASPTLVNDSQAQTQKTCTPVPGSTTRNSYCEAWQDYAIYPSVYHDYSYFNDTDGSLPQNQGKLWYQYIDRIVYDLNYSDTQQNIQLDKLTCDLLQSDAADESNKYVKVNGVCEGSNRFKYQDRYISVDVSYNKSTQKVTWEFGSYQGKRSDEKPFIEGKNPGRSSFTNESFREFEYGIHLMSKDQNMTEWSATTSATAYTHDVAYNYSTSEWERINANYSQITPLGKEKTWWKKTIVPKKCLNLTMSPSGTQQATSLPYKKSVSVNTTWQNQGSYTPIYKYVIKEANVSAYLVVNGRNVGKTYEGTNTNVEINYNDSTYSATLEVYEASDKTNCLSTFKITPPPPPTKRCNELKVITPSQITNPITETSIHIETKDQFGNIWNGRYEYKTNSGQGKFNESGSNTYSVGSSLGSFTTLGSGTFVAATGSNPLNTNSKIVTFNSGKYDDKILIKDRDYPQYCAAEITIPKQNIPRQCLNLTMTPNGAQQATSLPYKKSVSVSTNWQNQGSYTPIYKYIIKETNVNAYLIVNGRNVGKTYEGTVTNVEINYNDTTYSATLEVYEVTDKTNCISTFKITPPPPPGKKCLSLNMTPSGDKQISQIPHTETVSVNTTWQNRGSYTPIYKWVVTGGDAYIINPQGQQVSTYQGTETQLKFVTNDKTNSPILTVYEVSDNGVICIQKLKLIPPSIPLNRCASLNITYPNEITDPITGSQIRIEAKDQNGISWSGRFRYETDSKVGYFKDSKNTQNPLNTSEKYIDYYNGKYEDTIRVYDIDFPQACSDTLYIPKKEEPKQCLYLTLSPAGPFYPSSLPYTTKVTANTAWKNQKNYVPVYQWAITPNDADAYIVTPSGSRVKYYEGTETEVEIWSNETAKEVRVAVAEASDKQSCYSEIKIIPPAICTSLSMNPIGQKQLTNGEIPFEQIVNVEGIYTRKPSVENYRFYVNGDQTAKIDSVRDILGIQKQRKFTYNGNTPASVTVVEQSNPSVCQNTYTVVPPSSGVCEQLTLETRGQFEVTEYPYKKTIKASAVFTNNINQTAVFKWVAFGNATVNGKKIIEGPAEIEFIADGPGGFVVTEITNEAICGDELAISNPKPICTSLTATFNGKTPAEGLPEKAFPYDVTVEVTEITHSYPALPFNALFKYLTPHLPNGTNYTPVNKYTFTALSPGKVVVMEETNPDVCRAEVDIPKITPKKCISLNNAPKRLQVGQSMESKITINPADHPAIYKYTSTSTNSTCATINGQPLPYETENPNVTVKAGSAECTVSITTINKNTGKVEDDCKGQIEIWKGGGGSTPTPTPSTPPGGGRTPTPTPSTPPGGGRTPVPTPTPTSTTPPGGGSPYERFDHKLTKTVNKSVATRPEEIVKYSIKYEITESIKNNSPFNGPFTIVFDDTLGREKP